MAGRCAALSGCLTAGKTGKGNPKDDSKDGVINVFAPVWKVPCEISRSKTAIFFVCFFCSFFWHLRCSLCKSKHLQVRHGIPRQLVLLYTEFFYGYLHFSVDKPLDVIICILHKVTEGLDNWKCCRFYWYSTMNFIDRSHAMWRQVLGSLDLLVEFAKQAGFKSLAAWPRG